MLPDPPPVAPPVPVVRDPFPDAPPARLTGPAERQRYSPLLTALLGGILAFVVFQSLALVAMGVLLAAGGGLTSADPEALAALMAENVDTVFGANAIGQILGLGLVTLALTRLHTPDVRAYLRIGRPDAAFLALSGVGLFALMPFVSWLGALAKQIPLPEGLRAWDAQQAAMVDQILQGEVTLVLALLFVALTPAFCEEVLFRGFIQRNVERRFGVAVSLVLVGLAFGVFHLRPSELIPLTVLGVYLAYVVWVSGSLWPGVLVHLLNNGAAVIASNYAAGRPDPVALDEMAIPWYLAFAGLAFSLALIAAMQRRRGALLAPAGAPSPSP
jgi:uncharacterized protein